MKTNYFSKLSARLTASVCALTVLAVAAHADGFKPTWAESGLDKTVRASRPQVIYLSNKQPATLKQLPDGAAGANMGSFKTGTGPSVVNHAILQLINNGAVSHLCVDGNGDGVISPDEILDWTGEPFETPAGKTITNYSCRATITVTKDGKRGEVEFYFSPSDKRTAPDGAPRVIFYHTCFGVTGEINIGGRTVQAALEDAAGLGQFSLTGKAQEIPICWLDVSNDNKNGKVFSVNRPVEVDGKWWAITNLTPDGAFEMIPAPKPAVAAPKSAGPDLSPGHKAPTFTATMMDGKTVNFPGDYKGKIVLLDFWATWCGPCMAEVPNVVDNYGKYHSQGLEILGVTLDQEDAADQIKKVTAKKNMSWSQIYDGKYWQAAIAKLYGIDAIPHALLVDGDTGVILADKDIRGEKLGAAIEKALATKKK